MLWSEFWIWYTNATKEAQEDVLRQINLKKFLQRLTPKYQLEVLEGAPKDVIVDAMSAISVYTLMKLRMDTVSRNVILQ